ncbi:MAG: hypothetical protein ABFS03_00060 [Chloroflexota bacterium]
MNAFTSTAMMSPYPYQNKMHDIPNGRDLSRLLTAAVVNKTFRMKLLADPKSALLAGYNGEPFSLKNEDKDLILSIRASSLSEFAAQLSNHKHQNQDL